MYLYAYIYDAYVWYISKHNTKTQNQGEVIIKHGPSD